MLSVLPSGGFYDATSSLLIQGRQRPTRHHLAHERGDVCPAGALPGVLPEHQSGDQVVKTAGESTSFSPFAQEYDLQNPNPTHRQDVVTIGVKNNRQEMRR